MTSVRALMQVAVQADLTPHQMDVKLAPMDCKLAYRIIASNPANQSECFYPDYQSWITKLCTNNYLYILNVLLLASFTFEYEHKHISAVLSVDLSSCFTSVWKFDQKFSCPPSPLQSLSLSFCVCVWVDA